MRPLRLQLKGFTSFREEQEIDFSDLDLFALWGPTGSGKSSVIDAMTYALYGHVERVGKHPRELVSQGQKRMAVSFEFAVDAERYLVTRTTLRETGSTTVRLERWSGAEWASLSGSVREANGLVKEIVGLDYTAFARAVVLPQGKFAEFLNGEPRDRRDILTELLGLELFKKMKQHANDIASDARRDAETKRDLVEREYEGIDAAAVAAAHDAAGRARADAGAAEQAERSLEEALRAWEQEERTLERLRACEDDVAARAGVLRAASEALGAHARALSELGERKRAASAALEAAAREWKIATAELGSAEARWGRVDEVVALQQEAVRWADARDERAAAETELGAELDAEHAAQERVKLATEAVEELRERAAAATEVLARRRAEHEVAHRQNAVASLVVDLGPGDPCPVCAEPLAALPEVSPETLLQARAELRDAEQAERTAAAELGVAGNELAVATNALENARTGVARCRSECERMQARLDYLSGHVAAAFEDGLPDDPRAALSERVETLRALDAREKAAHAALEEAKATARDIEGSGSAIELEVAHVRGSLGSGELRAAVARAAEAADLTVPEVLAEPLPSDVGALAHEVEQAAGRLDALGAELEACAERRAEAQASVATEARAGLASGLGIEGDSLADMVASASAVARERAKAAALADAHAQALEEKLAKRADFEREIEAHRRDQEVYSELGRELRDDHIVQFLQGEALGVLALAATERLRALSGARYRMVFEDDEFFVVDAWNGDERRSVRTLSGGETFVASLALALALSEQVQMLAVSEKSKLESLFLDEGFGNLDAETLEDVVEAIEQLGGDGRLVGVITHVSEVADRMPLRLTVTKATGGSTIRRAPADALLG